MEKVDYAISADRLVVLHVGVGHQASAVGTWVQDISICSSVHLRVTRVIITVHRQDPRPMEPPRTALVDGVVAISGLTIVLVSFICLLCVRWRCFVHGILVVNLVGSIDNYFCVYIVERVYPLTFSRSHVVFQVKCSQALNCHFGHYSLILLGTIWGTYYLIV